MSTSDEAFDQAAQYAKLVGPERRAAYNFFEAGRAYQKEQDLAAVAAAKEMRRALPIDGFEVMAISGWHNACYEIARRIKES